MDTLVKDIRYGIRALLQHPVFTAIVVITLALGIGANTAIFSVVNAVLLRPLPYKDPSRLIIVHDFKDFRDRQQSFEQVAAFSAPWIFNVVGAGEPIQVNGQWVSANLLSTLGVTLAEGRVFTKDEDKNGAQERVVILSYGFWQRQLGGDKTVLGRSLNLDSQNFIVVGIAPPHFKIGDDSDLWVPLALNPINSRGRLVRYLSVIGRLKTGVTPAAAQSDLALIAKQLEQQYPDTK